MEYCLIDMERTLCYNKLYFWKKNKRGYTTEIMEIGLYTLNEVTEILSNDVEGNTVVYPARNITEIMKKFNK